MNYRNRIYIIIVRYLKYLRNLERNDLTTNYDLNKNKIICSSNFLKEFGYIYNYFTIKEKCIVY